jgi:hypothetical protein
MTDPWAKCCPRLHFISAVSNSFCKPLLLAEAVEVELGLVGPPVSSRLGSLLRPIHL